MLYRSCINKIEARALKAESTGRRQADAARKLKEAERRASEKAPEKDAESPTEGSARESRPSEAEMP